jgi:hypothetical protein
VLKGELHHPCDYIANILNPHTTNGITVTSLLASNTRQVQPGISNETKNYRVNLKSGVNFQVALKRYHAKRNHVKWDLSV